MKKVYFLLLPFLLVTGFAAFSQCTNTTSFGSATINPAGTITQISTCSFAGEYSTISGAVNGQTLSFTSSVATDFITIHSGSSSGPVVAFGTTPLSFANTFTGTLYAHWNTSSACGAQSACRTTTVQCTSCIPPPPPVNDVCSGAITINCGQTINDNTSSATPDAVATCVTTLNTAPGMWYTFVGDGQTSVLSLCGSSFDTKIGIFTGTCGSLVCVTGNDDFCGVQSQASVTTVLGTTYYVLVTGFSTASGAFTLNRTCVSAVPNDNCSGAININCGQTINGNTSAASADVVPTCVTTLNSAPGVWYSFTGNGADITLSLCGSAYDTKIGVFSGTCGSLTCVTGNDDFCGLQSQVTFTSVFGTQYYVLVTGFGSASGAFTLTRTCVFPNETCAGAININCGQVINGTTVGAAADAVGTCGTALGTAPGVWYGFIGDGSPVTMSLCGSAYDTKIGVFSGTCGTLTCVGGNDDFCGLQSQVTVNTVYGTQYYVLVTGFSTSAGNYTLTRTCAPACAGTPTPGTISSPSTAVCAGTVVPFSLGGNSVGPGISYQWKSSTTSGGPYTSIAGATSPTYNYTAVGTTTYFIVTVTCANGGLFANTPEFALTQSLPVHSAVSSTVVTACSPGTVTITGTVSGGVGTYTHTLTGPGTITQNPPSGPGNSTANFTVTNLPAGTSAFVLASADALGCSVSSNVSASINQTPIVTITPAAPVICNGTIQQLTASVVPPLLQTFTQSGTTQVPGGSPTTTSGNGDPYPSTLTTSGLPTTGVTVKSVKLGNINHTFPSDIDVVLVSPAGQAVILMSDIGGGTDLVGIDYTLDDAAAGSLTAAFNPQGTYKPTNIGGGDDWPAPGPGTAPTSTTLSTFSGNPNGGWKLYVVDDTGGDFGYIGNWSITFNIPSLVTFSPTTNLYTDALATIPYTGQPTLVVYAKPPATAVYTATSTVAGCTGTANVTVTVNQLPTITVQPTPATQTICAGFNVVYSVTATGTGLTYQWKQGAVNLVNNAQISGATTNTLTITNVNISNAGTYTCVVSGTCPPSVTSNAAVLNIATAPVISTQPANKTVCEGQSAAFTVATVGSVPPPTIFQWQVSTDGGVTWTNLTTGGSYTATYTIAATTIGQNNSRYRVIVTNNCGLTTTSSAAILTVNALPVVTAVALATRICISDTLIALSGSPVGGSWSGIGVSGFNFVPSATAVGTYTLTYSYTNPAGCTSTAAVIAKVEDCQERIRLLSDDGVLLYPNPNNGQFNIRINSTLYNYLGMKVYNAQGQLVNGKAVNDVLVSPVYTGLVYGRVIPIDLTKLPAGIYFVKFYYDDGVRTSDKTFKVVIGGH